MPYIVFDTKILNALLSNLKHPEKTVSLDRIMVNFFILKKSGGSSINQIFKKSFKVLTLPQTANYYNNTIRFDL